MDSPKNVAVVPKDEWLQIYYTKIKYIKSVKKVHLESI